MKNFTKQFNVMAVTGIGLLLFVFGFTLLAAGCARTTDNKQESAGVEEPGPTQEQLASEKIFPIITTDPQVFEAPDLGKFVTVDEKTVVKPAKMPFWTKRAIATAAFERENGKTYQVLVYERQEGEYFPDWMKRSEVGDAFLSDQRVDTRNGKPGFAYATNDYGAVPAVHITVFSDRYVYYFKTEEEQQERPWRIPEDFLNFVRETEVE